MSDKIFDQATTDGRIPWERKAESWHARREITDQQVINASAILPVFEAHRYPTMDFPQERPQFHVVVTREGDRFLVDTQGYSYARYIAKLPRVE